MLTAQPYQKADSLYEAGQYESASRLYEERFKVSAGNNDQYGFIWNLLMAANSHIGSHDYLTASRYADTALDSMAAYASAPSLWVRAYLVKAESELKSGRNDQALEALKNAKVKLENDTSLLAAEVYNDLGVVYWNNNNTTLAKGYHQKALTIRTAQLGNAHELVADSYLNLGLIYIPEDFLQAITYLDKALGLYKSHHGENSEEVALTYTNLASANKYEKNTLEAITYLDRTDQIWNSLYPGSHPNKAFTKIGQAEILLESGKLDEAQAKAETALQMYTEIYGEKHPEIANTYLLIGEIQLTAGKPKLAMASFQRAIYANLQNQLYTNVFELPSLEGYLNADILLSALQYKAKALEALHYDQSLKPKHLTAALLCYELCDELLTKIRQIRKNESDQLRLGAVAHNIYAEGIRIASYLASHSMSATRYRLAAFYFMERSKAAVLHSAINETHAKSFAGIPDSLLLKEENLKDKIAYLEWQMAQSPTGLDSLGSLLFQSRNELQGFLERLERQFPKYYELKYAKPDFDVADLQSSLPSGTALLSYFIDKDETYCAVVTEKKIELYTKDTPDFARLVSGMRNSMKYRIRPAFIKSSQQLYDQLIPDLQEHISQLLIVPHGMMSTVPFEALVSEVSEGQPQYLAHQYAVSYALSAQLTIDNLKAAYRPADHGADKSNGILLMAPVDFKQHNESLSSLPGSREEVKEIRYLFLAEKGPAHMRLQHSASEDFIKCDSLAMYKYLHFATHGVVNESKPALSRIFLNATSPSNDGSLYSGEIYNLKINADLVTLSACETGLGKVEVGEGLVGLSRSLTYAGAHNLIVSLWPVSDAATTGLMVQFYKEHLHHSMNMIFADDLRSAKLEMINSENYSDPYFWAPFVLIGL